MDAATLLYLESVRDRLQAVVHPKDKAWSMAEVFGAASDIKDELDQILDASNNGGDPDFFERFKAP